MDLGDDEWSCLTAQRVEGEDESEDKGEGGKKKRERRPSQGWQPGGPSERFAIAILRGTKTPRGRRFHPMGDAR